ncbi:malonyl-CoA decarboxylase [Terasakiella brassicae]|uniref:Malonyl-CoA decarboxylase n=1 Tax=Terasakiella brassicae TaxID=1634917 RepID=A0A917FFC1_9PROT|nr:malonyl-CoA decarboxylase [Terasakiella brassicae]GGF72484.1 malonyl-CoA decarboxylase [Terasakiella brassicae]
MADLLEKIKSWSFNWRTIAQAGGSEDALNLSPDLPVHQCQQVRKQLNACLQSQGGEVSARQRAATLGQAYLELNTEGRKRFLKILAEDFGTDRQAVDQSISNFQNATDEEAKRGFEIELRRNLEPARMTLLRQFNALPQGVKFLVDLRAELMQMAREESSLKIVERDLKDVLISWFDVGFLELRRLTWDSPASVLEKIAEYEAVHSIQSWSDLKNRLARDRRLFAFFHPRMPDEPLIFVEVALVNGMADNVQDLLDENAPLLDPDAADTAIFYSISNAQAGLAGISFGNFLIKKVVASLKKDLPNLKTFATLSPIPGFRKWLDETLAEGDSALLQTSEREALKLASGQKGAKGGLKALLDDGRWVNKPEACEALKAPLMRLAARYLTEAKRKGARPLDPVAHFHLSNGARMERLNWLGDVSQKGMKQSAGMMINYLYKLSDIEKNHEAYRGDGQIIVSSQIKSLKKG